MVATIGTLIIIDRVYQVSTKEKNTIKGDIKVLMWIIGKEDK